jgi:hypothetical protein
MSEVTRDILMIPETEDNNVGYKANNDSGGDEGVSSATVGNIRNGPECLQIHKYTVQCSVLI